MSPLELIQYYANLLILQYLQKPKAFATIQAQVSSAILAQPTTQLIAFSITPTSGSFILNWTPFGLNQTQVLSAAINWNDSLSTIQSKVRAMSTILANVTVTGGVSSASGLTITFNGVPPVAALMIASSNSLGSAITISETDIVLPLALSGAFNIDSALGPVSQGVQLDIIAKYVGVTRSTSLPTVGSITLDDTDFLTFIQFAAIKNSAGSDLSTIQNLLNQFFPGEIFVFDYQNMYMSYLISTTVGSLALAQALVAEGLLFRPMGVQLATPVFAPILNTFFGFRTYSINTINNSPANTYTNYVSGRPWVSYANGVPI